MPENNVTLMAKITQKIKEKLRGTKHKVTGAADKTTSKAKDSGFEKGRPGKEIGRREDPLTEYREKEPMTPAKLKAHEPTAVKREMSEKISGSGQTGTSSSEADRRSGMSKGTDNSAETTSEEDTDGASK